jgi:protein-L-isoaspartate(D-aspartate) O-methyltransferase
MPAQYKPGLVALASMIVLMAASCLSQENQPDDRYASARYRMVREQIKARGVTDPQVVCAMEKVPRHLFVPESYRTESYEDYPLPIGEGQTISQPYIVAFMTAALDLDRSDRVLEIGTGSGYQAAVLAEICDSVWSVEINPNLAAYAMSVLKELKYGNVSVLCGDGYKGWPGQAPFDAIIVTCAPTHVPRPLQEQLTEGGRMIIPVGEGYSQELVLLKKVKGRLEEHSVLPVRFVPMLDDKGRKY